MKKILLLFVLYYSINVSFAQTATGAKYSYYIEINGVDSKQKAKDVCNLVKAKPGVTLFNQYSAARPFFILMSDLQVTNKIFSDWIKTSGLPLVHFEAKQITAEFIRARRLEKAEGRHPETPNSGKH